MKSKLFLFFFIAPIFSFGQIEKIKAIEIISKYIDSAASENYKSIQSDTFSYSHFRTDFYRIPGNNKFLRIKDSQGKEGENIIIYSTYYIVDSNLIKVHISYSQPINPLFVEDLYYTNGAPIYPIHKPKKKVRSNYDYYLRKAKSLLE